MATTVRAALSVALLAGFYVLAAALLGGLAAVSVMAFENGAGTAGAKLAILCLVAGAALVAALWRVARAKPEPDPGVIVSPQDAPELWAAVTELAAVADTAAPDEIRLVSDVNAAVSEEARLLGLLPGPRRLYLGIPLLMGLDVAQLRSVLAHELGHYSRSHTRLGPLTYRGQMAILGTVERLSGNIVGWVLKLYAYLYLLVSAAVTRRQELEADELSVRVAGREVAQSALRELPVLDSAWSFYENAYLAPGWEVGLAPTTEGFFVGFGDLLAGRKGELDAMRAEDPPTEQSRWDSHPSIAARVAAMDRMADAAVTRDRRPATVLVPGIEVAARVLAEEVVAFGDRRRVGWEELTATATTLSEQRLADVAYRAAARVAGEQRGTLGLVLELVAAGRGEDLARQLRIRAEDEAEAPVADRAGGVIGVEAADVPVVESVTLADPLLVLLRAGAVQAGAAQWRHSWVGPAELVDATGTPLELEDLAALAADAATVDAARERIAALGIDVQRSGQASDQATAHGSEILGALANIDVDGKPHDVVVLDQGLVLVPCPKSKDGGKARLEQMLASMPVVELAAAHRFLALEDVARATVLKSIPARVQLHLHSGATVTLKESWTSETLTGDSSAILVAIAEDLAAPEPAASEV